MSTATLPQRHLEIRLRWNRPQSEFMRATEAFVDFEGAARAGKTTALIWKIATACEEHPGIHCLLSRFTEDHLNGQLKPRFYDLVPSQLLGVWRPDEEYHEWHNGSRVYLRALRSSALTAKYGKFTGLTLAIIGIDQAEELPFDYYQHLKARLSQAGFPQQMLLTPNPPGLDHWIAQEFPEENTRPGHRYIRTAMRDNAYLDEGTISRLETEYPPGHALRRPMLEGRRGVSVSGDPVYGKLFRREVHVNPAVAFNPELPLFEAWDFGKAAVLWSQFTLSGGWHLLAEVMGGQQFIEEFAPEALHVRSLLFNVKPEMVKSCCDPAGAARQGHGIRKTAVEVLQDCGVRPQWLSGANHPARRYWAIQEIARYLARHTREGPALQIHPRCRLTADAFEAGYVWEESPRGTVMGNIRMPQKDGLYDHLMNCLEYTLLVFGPTTKRAKPKSVKIAQPTWRT